MSNARKRKSGHAESFASASSERSSQIIKVTHAQNYGDDVPVFVSSPGLQLPQGTAFQSYKRPLDENTESTIANGKTSLLLQSSQHRTLDYVASEVSTEISTGQLQHYLGIYDPTRQELRLLPARHCVTQSSLRPEADAVDPKTRTVGHSPSASRLNARNELGLTFGTKKSKKAIQSNAANAIKGSPIKPSQNGDSQGASTLDPLSRAVVDGMADVTASMPSRQDLQAAIAEGKPIPKPHMDATEPVDVYPAEELVGERRYLERMPVKEWIDTIKKDGDVPTKSLFVSRRLVSIVKEDNVPKVKMLRYLLLLVEWYLALKPAGKSSKMVPKMEELGNMVELWGSDFLASLQRRFSSDRLLSRWHQELLTTHILALALHIDNFNTDIYHLTQDLRLKTSDMSKLYHELGCTMRRPTPAEREKGKITGQMAPSHMHAILKIPLEFPKARRR